MAAPLYGYFDQSGQQSINPVYGSSRDEALQNYNNAVQAEQGLYKPPGSASTSDPTDKLYGHLDRATDKAFDYQKQIMGETNKYRTKEGATQSQIDDRAFQRLSAELETRKYTQQKGAELTNWQRDQDQGRALASFKR